MMQANGIIINIYDDALILLFGINCILFNKLMSTLQAVYVI